MRKAIPALAALAEGIGDRQVSYGTFDANNDGFLDVCVTYGTIFSALPNGLFLGLLQAGPGIRGIDTRDHLAGLHGVAFADREALQFAGDARLGVTEDPLRDGERCACRRPQAQVLDQRLGTVVTGAHCDAELVQQGADVVWVHAVCDK